MTTRKLQVIILPVATSPHALYVQLLASMGEVSEERACTMLRAYLRRARSDWPPELSQVIEASGVSPGYISRHLLSIRRFEPDVRSALQAGLPLAVCRLVNGLPNASQRAEVLQPLWSVRPQGASGALLPKGVAAKVERRARHLRARPAMAGVEPQAQPSAEGWLEPLSAPAIATRPKGDVWIYPAQSRAERSAERLPLVMIEGLIATYLAPGDRIVDVTAGAGTFGTQAQCFGVASWSGDIMPGAPFVHSADARTLMSEGVMGGGTRPEPGTAAALLLHPPTFPAWFDGLSEPARGLATLEGYTDEVAAMIGGSIGVLAPGGVILVVTRPVRFRGQVSLVTSHLSVLLVEFGLELVGYHLAVADDGREDWHALVGRRSH